MEKTKHKSKNLQLFPSRIVDKNTKQKTFAHVSRCQLHHHAQYKNSHFHLMHVKNNKTACPKSINKAKTKTKILCGRRLIKKLNHSIMSNHTHATIITITVMTNNKLINKCNDTNKNKE